MMPVPTRSGDASAFLDFFHLFRLFIRAQAEFEPDKIDILFELQTELDVSHLLALARQKVG
jgi:hypothetical protein